ncbi:MAG: class II fructose-bisphosphatase [Pseudomonadota bacterium]
MPSAAALPPRTRSALDRNLALEFCRVTEAAALAAAKWLGRGDETAADAAAVRAMRWALSGLDIDGRVVIGEGERDQAPMLYIGEQVGTGRGPKVDIALDPLEGTTLCATGGDNSITVMAVAAEGHFLAAPDVYMEKIAVGNDLPEGVVDLDDSPARNLRNLVRAKKIDMPDAVVCILDRPRHEELIAKVREAGARIRLIRDGDVAGVMATALPESGIDMYMGIGGAPEGVLAAAALSCTGGQMMGRLMLSTADHIARAKTMGVTDPNKVYTREEMVAGHVMFAATGVTDGTILRGVRRNRQGALTDTLVMRSQTGTVRRIQATHDYTRKTLAS